MEDVLQMRLVEMDRIISQLLVFHEMNLTFLIFKAKIALKQKFIGILVMYYNG